MQVTNLSNVLFFSEKNKVFKKKNKTFSLKEQELFKIWPVVFFHNGIYMPKRLIFPSDLSAPPQTPCPSAFRLKDWGYGILQPSGNVSAGFIFGGVVVLKDIFRLKHFVRYILQPECRQAGRLRSSWKIWRKSKAFRHVDTIMEKTTGQIFKSSCSSNENILFFFLKTLFFSEKNRTFERLVTCMPEGW